MKFDKVLENRRAIRRYKNEPIDHEDIRRVLKAAILAPSWKNSQCPHWYVVTNDQLLAELRENGLPAFNAKNTENAPCLIVVCYEPRKSGMGNDGEYANAIGEGWSCFDCGLAVENLCLEATRLDLGTLIMGIYNEQAIRQALSIPGELKIMCVVALGKPDIDPEMPKRNKLKDVAVFKD